jgi:hypothetical protein
MKSSKRDIRWRGAKAVSPEGAKYESLILPHLLAMLDNPESNEWEEAGIAIMNCEFKSGAGKLREAANRAKDAKIKQNLLRYADELTKPKPATPKR